MTANVTSAHLIIFSQIVSCVYMYSEILSKFWKIKIFSFVFSGPYGCVNKEHTVSLLRNILEGVDYIHSRGIMHRDLKVM